MSDVLERVTRAIDACNAIGLRYFVEMERNHEGIVEKAVVAVALRAEDAHALLEAIRARFADAPESERPVFTVTTLTRREPLMAERADDAGAQSRAH